MQLLRFILVAAFCLTPLATWAQSNPNSPPPESGVAPPDPVIAQSQSETLPPPPAGSTMVRKEVRIMGGPASTGYEPLGGREFGPGLGAWWKNSEVVSKLQLSDEQARKISQTFLDHKLKLIDLFADVEKQELRLQPLLDLDQPDESKVGTQIDLLTAARGRLEKENAMMMLDIRRQLSVEQWKKLKSIQGAEEERGMKKTFFFRSNGLGGGQGINIEGPPPPPPNGDTPVRPPPMIKYPQ